MKPQDFISKLAPLAQEEQRKHGILASVTIAQGILESAWGESGLTKRGNNLFGIKGSTGDRYETKEQLADGSWVTIKAGFRHYPDWSGSVKDHSKVLLLPRYKKLIGEKDYRKATRYLYEAGYATDKQYASKLNSLIEKYNLDKYNSIGVVEKPVPKPAPVKPAEPKPAVGNMVKVKSTAKHWATGETIAKHVYSKYYRVKQVKSDRILLDGVMSWILIKDTTVI